MSPYQHGEVYVLDDGSETDLDLGHYERFTSTKLTRESNYTTGQIYLSVINQERRGEFLGNTVQVTQEIDICGGTSYMALKKDSTGNIARIDGSASVDSTSRLLLSAYPGSEALTIGTGTDPNNVSTGGTLKVSGTITTDTRFTNTNYAADAARFGYASPQTVTNNNAGAIFSGAILPATCFQWLTGGTTCATRDPTYPQIINVNTDGLYSISMAALNPNVFNFACVLISGFISSPQFKFMVSIISPGAGISTVYYLPAGSRVAFYLSSSNNGDSFTNATCTFTRLM
jgi:hypothetical protein